VSGQNLDIFILYGRLITDSNDSVHRQKPVYGKIEYIMRSILKVSGVTEEVHAQLAQFFLDNKDKLTIKPECANQRIFVQPREKGQRDFGDNKDGVYLAPGFRLIKPLEIEVEDGGTFACTFAICFAAWTFEGDRHFLDEKLHRDFLRIIYKDVLPPADNSEQLKKITKLLLPLRGKRSPVELYDEYRGQVVVGIDDVLSIDVIMTEIFPVLVSLSWKEPTLSNDPVNREVMEFLRILTDARKTARSMQ
jgi:hypothetical protein